MSWDATAWAKGVTAGGPGPKAVLLCLADRADEDWSCFPSQKLLAAETEQSVRTVQRQLQGLEESGLIGRVHRAREDGTGRSSDRYVLLGRDDNLSGDNLSRKGSLTRQNDGGLSDNCVVPGTPKEHPEEQEQEHVAAPPLDDVLVSPAVGRFATGLEIEKAFEDFWAAYPKSRRVARKACRAKFITAVRNGTDPQVIIEAIKARVAWWDQEGTADNYRTTSLPWLNQGRWEDEIVGLRAKVRPVTEAYAFTENQPHREPTWETA